MGASYIGLVVSNINGWWGAPSTNQGPLVGPETGHFWDATGTVLAT